MEITLGVLRWTDLAGDGVAGAQAETPDLAGRDVDVVGPGQVGAFGRTQEPEPILQDLQNTVAEDVLAFLRPPLEDAEDDVLLTRAGDVFYAHVGGQIDQFRRRHSLEFTEVHLGWLWCKVTFWLDD